MLAIQPLSAPGDDAAYTVRYQPYDARLPAVFDAVARLVRGAAGPVTVEHVGSTAIPGVGGRNALDVAVAVEEDAQPAVREALRGLGFQDSPFPHYLPLLVGRLAHQGASHPVLLYLVSPHADVYRDWLAFRDHMRSHPDDAQAYDRVKQQAAGTGAVDGERYQQAKSPFLDTMAAKLGRAGGDL